MSDQCSKLRESRLSALGCAVGVFAALHVLVAGLS